MLNRGRTLGEHELAEEGRVHAGRLVSVEVQSCSLEQFYRAGRRDVLPILSPAAAYSKSNGKLNCHVETPGGTWPCLFAMVSPSWMTLSLSTLSLSRLYSLSYISIQSGAIYGRRTVRKPWELCVLFVMHDLAAKIRR